MTAVAADGISQIAQYVTLLPLASLRDREQTCSRDFAVAATVAETDLAPLDGSAQDSLGYVVGRLHAVARRLPRRRCRLKRKHTPDPDGVHTAGLDRGGRKHKLRGVRKG